VIILAVLGGSALALGGIAGGILSSVTGNYLANIAFRIVLTVLLFFVCLFFIKEQPVYSAKH
jgi:hypothetical protein